MKIKSSNEKVKNVLHLVRRKRQRGRVLLELLWWPPHRIKESKASPEQNGAEDCRTGYHRGNQVAESQPTLYCEIHGTRGFYF